MNGRNNQEIKNSRMHLCSYGCSNEKVIKKYWRCEWEEGFVNKEFMKLVGFHMVVKMKKVNKTKYWRGEWKEKFGNK